MNVLNCNKTIDPDIVDYECLLSTSGARDLTRDLSGDSSSSAAYVPVLYKLPEHKVGNREFTFIESYLRKVLCVEILKYTYILEAAGKTRTRAKEIVSNKLTTLSIDKAIQYGRAACADIYNVRSGDDLRDHVKRKHLSMAGNANRIEFEALIIRELGETIFFLDLAYSRAREMHTALYHAGKLDGLPGGDEAFGEALTYRKSARLPDILEAAAISIWSGLGADMLWQNFFFYRYVLAAVSTLLPMMSGKGHALSAKDAYILYRMCENDISPEQGHGKVKHLVQQCLGGIIGIDKFMGFVDDVLEPSGLLTNRPTTVTELITRCRVIESPVFSYPAIPLGQRTAPSGISP
ncbi:hypothetical protein [Silvimonas sp.]|jgi:hypothetical protein|uniref:hypothetical protein n=1 Tax=Silvimonas sp. TaxID=2650811 RepID=UPI00284DA713|nr:hypothetical protein [Silvimonas sp.]MDR3428086.1 hypothetical protein [Silvimonas sp.]